MSTVKIFANPLCVSCPTCGVRKKTWCRSMLNEGVDAEKCHVARYRKAQSYALHPSNQNRYVPLTVVYTVNTL